MGSIEEDGLRGEANSSGESLEALSKEQQGRLKLKGKFKKEAIALLLSAAQEGRTQREFEQDYFDLTGKCIPCKELGYDSVKQLINDCSDAIEIRFIDHLHAPRLYPIIPSEVSHLAHLIQQQRPNHINRIGGAPSLSYMRSKVFANISAIINGNGDYSLLALSKLEEEYNRRYEENLESSVQRLFGCTLVEYLKEDMKWNVELFERGDRIYVQKKREIENWDTAAWQLRQEPPDALVRDTPPPPPPPVSLQQHWRMAPPPYFISQNMMPMRIPTNIFLRPTTAMNYPYPYPNPYPYTNPYSYTYPYPNPYPNPHPIPLNMCSFGNQTMNHPWTQNVMVRPLLMPPMSSSPPSLAASCAMSAPFTSNTANSLAAPMRTMTLTDENERPRAMVGEEQPLIVVEDQQPAATSQQSLTAVAESAVPFNNELIAEGATNENATNEDVSKGDVTNESEQDFWTPPLSFNEASMSATMSAVDDWSRDEIDADESVEQLRLHLLNNFPYANELMIMLMRIFRQASVDGILFSEFDNSCRRVLGFPLPYSQYDMWGPSDLVDNELIVVERTAEAPIDDGFNSVAVLRIFPGRVLLRHQSHTSV
uniref:HTH OST-type domain-containing protein n=1 Tax=Plectus sambesii TaxID=2011161 RepID=A0A914XDP2_9BILA